MNSIVSQIFNFIRHRISHKNRRLLISLIINLLILFVANSLLFLLLMKIEGQHYNLIDAFYWTLTIFTTLGLGDIVFESLVGRLFTIWVLLSGILAFFILTPYIFYQFFQSEARAPRTLRHKMSGHVVIVGYNAITNTLIEYFVQYRQPYTLITEDLQLGLRLHDEGVNAVIGDITDSQTYKNVRIHNAAMVVAVENDLMNANIALTVREFGEDIPLVATGSLQREMMLKQAGCTMVISPDLMIGKTFARRIIAGDAVAHPIGTFENFIIAESSVANTPLVGKTLREARIREICGLNAIGIWERGVYAPAGPDTLLGKNTILVLAGTREQLDSYNALLCIYNVSDPLVMIIGEEGVGGVVANELLKRHIRFKLFSRSPGDDNHEDFDLSIKNELGETEASAVIITTSEDDLNIMLTLTSRSLLPNIQIISRSVSEKNVSTLYQAGADFVLSYAAIGASAIINRLRGGDMLILTEGLNIHRLPVPKKIAGKLIRETDIRQRTGCSIVAIQAKQETIVNPGPEAVLPADGKIFLIGNMDAKKTFYRLYT